MSMQLVEKRQHIVKEFDVAKFLENPYHWLNEQAIGKKLNWLLAHAEDVIIWGQLKGDVLATSIPEINQYAPHLREVRLFGETGEWLLWRERANWRGRLIEEGDGLICQTYDEPHLMWGSKVVSASEDFSIVSEERDVLELVLPIASLPAERQTRVALKVRHTLDYDKDGQAFIDCSRLAGLGKLTWSDESTWQIQDI